LHEDKLELSRTQNARWRNMGQMSALRALAVNSQVVMAVVEALKL
jgi:hypothetical protein